MRIETVRVSDFRGALAGDVDIPARWGIPRERAVAQINNPRAAEGDQVLFVAHDDSGIVGSVGVIPDVAIVNGTPARMGWLNHWAADPTKRGVGGLLLLAAIRAYDSRLGVSGFTEEAGRVYLGSRRFATLCQKSGASLYVRVSSSRYVRRRLSRFAILSPVFAVVDAALNLVVDARLKRFASAKCRDLVVTETDTIDDEIASFIENVRASSSFARGVPELEWIQRFDWDLSRGSRRTFVIVRDTRRMIVCVLLVIEAEDRLTVPYHYCAAADFGYALAAVVQALSQSSASELLVYDRRISDGIRRMGVRILAERPRERAILVSTSLPLEASYVYDGDGDGFVG